MNPKIISIKNNNQAGVFIPLEEWNIMKQNYPEIENTNDEILDWQKCC